MKSKSIFKRAAAVALSAVLTLTGIELPVFTASAEEGNPTTEDGEAERSTISLPLELYDYQSDGLLFQYKLSDNWALTNAVVNGAFWDVLNAAAKADLAGTAIKTNPAETASIIEGLVEESDTNGLTYRYGTYELLSWYLLNTIRNVDPTFPMIDEAGAEFIWDGTTYDWNFADYEKYSTYFTEDTDPETLSGEERAYYEMYYRDYYPYDDAIRDDIHLCKLYFDYYVAKVQWNYADYLKGQAAELAANMVSDADATATLLGIVKTAIDDYNGYTGAITGAGNEAVTGDGIAEVCRINSDLKYYYGVQNSELDAQGFTYVPLTGGLPGENDTGYQADLEEIRKICASPALWQELLTVIGEAGKGEILNTAEDRILAQEKDAEGNVISEVTWDTYYSVIDFVPGFDYLYQNMAYTVNEDDLLEGFANWYIPQAATSAARYSISYDITDTTQYHVFWKTSEDALELGAATHNGKVGAKRTFSLEPGTYTVEWSVARSGCGLLLTDGTGSALEGFDQLECPVGAGQSGTFTLTEASDITVLFYFEGQDDWSDISDFYIKDSAGNYITKNDSYGEFFDSGVPYRWSAVADTDGDGICEKEVAFDNLINVQKPVNIHPNGNYWGFKPLKISGDMKGEAAIVLDVEPGTEYTISYGQTAYIPDSDTCITEPGAGSMTAVMTGADLQGEITLGKGVTEENGESGQIITKFTASEYNVDGIMANPDQALTSYTFIPDSSQVTICFSASGTDYEGWISGFSVKKSSGETVFEIPYDNSGETGWMPVLQGKTSGVHVNISGDFADSVGIEQNYVSAGAFTDDFTLDETLSDLKIKGDSTGDKLYSPDFYMNLKESYTLSYDVKLKETDAPNYMLGNMEFANDELWALAVPNGASDLDEISGFGNYVITDKIQNPDGTYWVTLSWTFTAPCEQGRIVLHDTSDNMDGYEIRNISIKPANNKAYNRGNETEARAAEAYAAAYAEAGSGIRSLIDAFAAYHQEQGDANGMTAYDYVYYMLTNLFDGSSIAARQIDAYNHLALEPVTNEITTVTSKKTGESYELATYGFYATSIANQTNEDGTVTERNQASVILAPKTEEGGTGAIYNDLSSTEGQLQLFPLNGMGYESPVDNTIYYGNNYNYVMHSGGRFVYHEADNLVFMFTGDDDVYLYLNDKLALDLGGAHTAYSDYVFVNDVAEELGLEENGVYNFDFYYMERHTTESELKVVTNISVLDAKAILTKGASGAYYAASNGQEDGIAVAAGAIHWEENGSDTVDEDRKNIPSGSAVPKGEKVYYLQLVGGELPLDEIRFDDEVLGVHIGAALYDADGAQIKGPEITLNEETKLSDLKIYILDKDGNVRNTRKHQLIGNVCICDKTKQLTEDDYKNHLLQDVFGEGAGIEENETLIVDGIRHMVDTGITNVASAQALIRDYDEYLNNGQIASDTEEQLEINKAYHSMNVDEQYYVEGNAANHKDGYVLMDILANEDFNGKSYQELTPAEKASLVFRAYDKDGNLISQDVQNADGTVTKAAVLFDAETGTIRFRPEDLTAKDSSDSYTTTIYYDFDATQTIGDMLYSSNPVPVTIHVCVLQNDVYVLDYGLGVSLTGGSNDMFANDKYEIEKAGAENYLGISSQNGADYADQVQGADGTLTSKNADGFTLKSYDYDSDGVSIQYHAHSFMDEIEQFAYGVEVKDNDAAVITEKQDNGIRLNGQITVMPATVVYYEDNFSGIVTAGTESVPTKENLIQANTEWKLRAGGTEILTTDYSAPIQIAAINGGVDWESYLIYTDNEFFNKLESGKTYTLTASVYSDVERTIVIGSENARDFYQLVHLNAGTNYIAVPYTKATPDAQNGQQLAFYLGNPSDSLYSAENSLDAHTLVIKDVAFTEDTEERLQDNSLETWYGYDAAYGEDSSFSNGSYTLLNSTDKIGFTFKGTGFDLLARVTDVNAAVRVQVYKADEVELKSYQLSNGKTFLSAVKKDGVEKAELVNQALVNTYYENGEIYQVPVVSMTMPEYGEYVVVAQYIGTADDSDNTEALYVDGVRIYNPLGTDTDAKKEADAVGYLPEEQNARTKEVRSMVFGEEYQVDYVTPADPAKSEKSATASLIRIEQDGKFNISYGSTVVEGFTGHMSSAEIAQAENPMGTDSLLSYAVNGPNNELYLTDGNKGFAWGTVVTAAEGAVNPAIWVGLKAVAGTPFVKYKNQAGEWVALEGLSEEGRLTTATERYYKLPALEELYQVDGKAVLLIQAEEGIASFTKLKYNDVTFAAVKTLGENAITYDAAKTPFSILSKGSSSTITTLTFSAAGSITDFTIQGGTDISFTYDGVQTLPNGIRVSAREADGMTIYVVKMPKQTGDYTITTAGNSGYSAAGFTIE